MARLIISGITFDAAEPERLAAWWAGALGWDHVGRTCRSPNDALARIEFMPVSDPKLVKNRVHLDLGADDVQAEVERFIALGATVAWEETFPPGTAYRNVVLRDPEGNEFCVGGPPGAAPDSG